MARQVKNSLGYTVSQGKLKKNYDNFEQFKYYSELYGLHQRLGYSSPMAAWSANPTIQWSTHPGDFKRVRETKQRAKHRNHCGRPHQKYVRRKNSGRKFRNPHPSGLTYGEQIQRAWKQQKKKGDKLGMLYYETRGPSSASASWEQFKNSWAGQEWIRKQKVNNPRKLLKTRRQLSVPERHQLKIALSTLKMSDAGARIMGGPTKAEAREIIFRFTGRTVKENPAKRRAKKAKTYFVVTDNEGAWLTETPSKKDTIVFGPTTKLFEAERALSREIGSGD